MDRSHDAWLRQQHLPGAATRMAFDSDYDAVLTVAARRDRLDAAIITMAADCEFTPVVHRLGCLRGVSTLTGFALASRSVTGTGSPAPPSAPTRSGAVRVLLGRLPGPGRDHQDRQRPRPPATGRGRLAPPSPVRVGKTMRDRWDLAPRRRARGTKATGGCTPVGRFNERHKRHVVANVAVARELAGWCWSLAVMDMTTQAASSPRPVAAARGVTRETPMSNRPLR